MAELLRVLSAGGVFCPIARPGRETAVAGLADPSFYGPIELFRGTLLQRAAG
jgi:hypothetical protein